ncbi:MAG: hypothetical protein QM651_04975 [Rhodoblastus sp.]
MGTTFVILSIFLSVFWGDGGLIVTKCDDNLSDAASQHLCMNFGDIENRQVDYFLPKYLKINISLSFAYAAWPHCAPLRGARTPAL